MYSFYLSWQSSENLTLTHAWLVVCVISFLHVGYAVLFFIWLLILIVKYSMCDYSIRMNVQYKYICLCTISWYYTIKCKILCSYHDFSQLSSTCLKNNSKQTQWLTSPVTLIIMTWLAMVRISVMLASWSTVTFKNIHICYMYITFIDQA